MKQLSFTIAILLFVLNAKAQHMGIGDPVPGSKLSVKGNLSIGTDYSSHHAPANGAIIQGNVGIGDSLPSCALSVQQYAFNNSTEVQISNTSGFGNSQLSFIQNKGQFSEFRPGYIQSSDDPFGNLTGSLNFYTNGIGTAYGSVLGMSVTNGRVGVGTLTPECKLSVNGNLGIGSVYSTLPGIANGAIVQGNLGIGDSVPTVPLSVSANLSGGTTEVQISNRAINGNTRLSFLQSKGQYDEMRAGYIESMDIGFGNGIGALDFYTNGVGTPYGSILGMSVTNGMVGVGTLNPSVPLHVYSSSASVVARMQGDHPSVSFFDNTDGNMGFLRYNYNSSSGISSMQLGSTYMSGGSVPVTIAPGQNANSFFMPDGSLGIGTPYTGATLHVSSSSSVGYPNAMIENTGGGFARLRLKNDINNNGWTIAAFQNNTSNGSADVLNFYNENTSSDVMSIKGDGKVGIGTSSPSQKLEVNNGNLKITNGGIVDGNNDLGNAGAILTSTSTGLAWKKKSGFRAVGYINSPAGTASNYSYFSANAVNFNLDSTSFNSSNDSYTVPESGLYLVSIRYFNMSNINVYPTISVADGTTSIPQHLVFAADDNIEYMTLVYLDQGRILRLYFHELQSAAYSMNVNWCVYKLPY